MVRKTCYLVTVPKLVHQTYCLRKPCVHRKPWRPWRKPRTCYVATLEPSTSNAGDNGGLGSQTSERDQEKLSSKLFEERVQQAQERTKNLKLCLYNRAAERLVESTESILNKITERQEKEETGVENPSTTDSLYISLETCLMEVERIKGLLQQVSTEQDKQAISSLSKLQLCEYKLYRALNEHFQVEELQTQKTTTKKAETGEHSNPIERRKMPKISVPIKKAADRFLRNDGSIDFAAVRSSIEWLWDAMIETWQRLNGRSSEQRVNSGYQVLRDKRLVLDSDSIKETKRNIEVLEKELQDTSRAREIILRKEDALGKLKKLREIRALDEKVDNIRKTLAIKVMQVELERVYMLLRQEVELSDDFNEQEILIAAFENADIQLARLSVFADSNVALLVSDDELGLTAASVEDVRSRLGLETDAYISGWEWNKLQTYFVDIWKKSKQGFEFYSRGTKLLGGDIMYAFRAISGYTLSPREVRTLRRTGRDLLTLVPFTLILILPLTPVGHVLVFSFIQRYFPDFFPSTFSEKRQQRMKRYEAIVSNVGNSDGPVNNELEMQNVRMTTSESNTFSSVSHSLTKNDALSYVENRKPNEELLETLPSLDEVHLAE